MNKINARQVVTVRNVSRRALEEMAANHCEPVRAIAAGLGAFRVPVGDQMISVEMKKTTIKGPRYALAALLAAFCEHEDERAEAATWDCETDAQMAFAERAVGRMMVAIKARFAEAGI